MFRPSQEIPTSRTPASGGNSLADLPTERLEHEIVTVAGQLAATTCRWLGLIAEYDRRGAHESWGFSSCATWLAWQCSLDPRSAREHVRVARSLAELALIRGAFARGELSYSKVRAITRIAKSETEADLLELARHATASQLDRVTRDFERHASAASAFHSHESRSLHHRWDEDGCLRIDVRLAPAEGAAFLRALEAAESFEEPGAEPQARRADALSALAESFLASGPKRRSAGERHEVVVHVEADTLAGGGAGRCELEAGSAIAAESARRISCDASLVAMLDGPEGPLSVSHKRRTIPASTRRALNTRDGCCRFPGCVNRRFVEGHHIQHWAKGGETSLDNLVVLCTHHHRLVHEGGFEARRGQGGEIHFHRPNGREVVARPRCASGQLAAPRVTPGGIQPLSRGEPLDCEHTVWGLLARAGPAD